MKDLATKRAQKKAMLETAHDAMTKAGEIPCPPPSFRTGAPPHDNPPGPDPVYIPSPWNRQKRYKLDSCNRRH